MKSSGLEFATKVEDKLMVTRGWICIFALAFVLSLASCKAPPGGTRRPVVIDEKASISRAQELFLAGDYKKALKPLEDVLSLGPRSRARAEAAYWAGFCYLKLNNYERASGSFRYAAAKLKTPFYKGPALVGLGDSEAMSGNYATAAKNYEQALSKYRKYIDAPEVEKRLGLAKAKEKAARGRTSESKKKLARKTAHPVEPKPYTVQLGAFNDRSAAKKLLQRARRSGYTGYIEHQVRGTRTLYCVRIGRYATKSDALDAAKRLKTVGFEAIVVQ